MGKMKEEFLNNREKEIIQEAIDAFMDDDYQYQEYHNSLAERMGYGRSITIEESQANHDAWWDSLTDEQKQQLYIDQEEAFKQDKS